MSCTPSYAYRPSFTPSNATCSAPVFALQRGRVTTQGSDFVTPLFFRSVQQSFAANDIEIEGTEDQLRVYFRGVLVETYLLQPAPGTIAALRISVQGSQYIEMPSVGVDVLDERTEELDGDGTMESGYGPFLRVALTGGSGAPTDGASIASIRTGPQRTLFIVGSIEDVFGNSVTPGPSQQIQQWNGSVWISYCNTTPGECPKEGTC